MLSPIVPHISHELWKQFGETSAIINEDWPEADPELLVDSKVEIIVQINGKLRGRVQVDSFLDKESIEDLACSHEKIIPYLKDKKLKKVIYIENKLINFVI